jgi:ribosomal protein L30E
MALKDPGYQAITMTLTDRIRGQARSYSGFGSSPNFAFDATSVGAGLLANAGYQAMAMALTDRGE